MNSRKVNHAPTGGTLPCFLLLSLLSLPALANGIRHDFDVSPGGTLRVVAAGASVNVETGPVSRVEIEITRHCEKIVTIRMPGNGRGPTLPLVSSLTHHRNARMQRAT